MCNLWLQMVEWNPNERKNTLMIPLNPYTGLIQEFFGVLLCHVQLRIAYLFSVFLFWKHQYQLYPAPHNLWEIKGSSISKAFVNQCLNQSNWQQFWQKMSPKFEICKFSIKIFSCTRDLTLIEKFFWDLATYILRLLSMRKNTSM